MQLLRDALMYKSSLQSNDGAALPHNSDSMSQQRALGLAMGHSWAVLRDPGMQCCRAPGIELGLDACTFVPFAVSLVTPLPSLSSNVNNEESSNPPPSHVIQTLPREGLHSAIGKCSLVSSHKGSEVMVGR